MMAPAFSSTRQAAAFALLLLATVLLPAAMRPSMLPPRSQVYSSIPWSAGGYPYIHQQIFEETGDIDIVFMGSSGMWEAMDTPRVQSLLGEKLARPAVVRSLCWNWNGFDSLLVVASDLLAHRRVKMLVLNFDVNGTGNSAHAQAPAWFRFGDNAPMLDGLPGRSKASYYSCAILGMPRTLVSLLRNNLPIVPSEKVALQFDLQGFNPMFRLGTLVREQGWGYRNTQLLPFAHFTPTPTPRATEASIHPGQAASSFRISPAPLFPLQAALLQKVAALAEQHGVKVVMLHIPFEKEKHSATIDERQIWPPEFQDKVTWLGIPPAKLYDGLSDDQIRMLYRDNWHMNFNGQRYFTNAIAPALVEFYARSFAR